MKATYKTLTIFLSLILIAGSTMALDINTGSLEKDITKNTTLTDKSQPEVNPPITEKTTFNLLNEPEYWVNYLKSTLTEELETIESPSAMMVEMETNPTYWVDYLKTVETFE